MAEQHPDAPPHTQPHGQPDDQSPGRAPEPSNSAEAKRLAGLVDAWSAEVEALLALLRELRAADWERPTDLPGWPVRAVVAHLAHLESSLAGVPQPEVEVPPADHVHGMMGQFTESGVVARATATPTELIKEVETSTAARLAALRAHPPGEAGALGPGFAALLGWSWETLLANRVLDVWMHGQDIRRATGRPAALDSPAAAVVADVFARSLPYVLARRASAPGGTTATLEIIGPHARTVAVAVGEDGRGLHLPTAPPAPDVRLRTDLESWTRLAGGRCAPDEVDVALEGDLDLGRRVLAGMAVTP